MPVVIEEMTVQVEVNQNQAANAVAPNRTADGPMDNPHSELIRQSVEEVMQVLRQQKER